VHKGWSHQEGLSTDKSGMLVVESRDVAGTGIGASLMESRLIADPVNGKQCRFFFSRMLVLIFQYRLKI